MEPELPCIENNLDDSDTDVSVDTFRANQDQGYSKYRALKVHCNLFVPKISYLSTIAFLYVILLGKSSCRSGFERKYPSLSRSFSFLHSAKISTGANDHCHMITIFLSAAIVV